MPKFMLVAARDLAKSWLFGNSHIVWRTPDSEVLALLRKLRPQDCGIGLVRVGGSGDGGYLIPDDLQGIKYCFSPGVGPSSEFESGLADLGIRSFLADHSVTSPTPNRPEFVFDRKFLGACDRDEYFTLSTWKQKYLPDYRGDLLLQMDIEGAEYEVILATPDDLLAQFRIAVIEFHALDRLFDPFTFRLFSACFEKLLKSFHVVHIHPNNMCRRVKKGRVEILTNMEFTFLNKSRARATKPRLDFPHELDRDNFPTKPMLLPGCWYRFDKA